MQIKQTNDQSDTLWSETFGENYHSIHGAWTESMHVFIDAGFRKCHVNPVSVFEMGFGTGLNAYLCLLEASSKEIQVFYNAVELVPVPLELIQKLHFGGPEFNGQPALYQCLHQSEWNTTVEITNTFSMQKENTDLITWKPSRKYDLVFYDAFSPNVQPELWTVEVFEKLYNCMNNNGILTTYCAKGSVRRNLQSAGFSVERIQGPPGKREMLRATKQT